MDLSIRDINHNKVIVDALYDFEDDLTDDQREAFKDAWNVARDMFDMDTMEPEFNHCIVQHMIDSGHSNINLSNNELIL